MKIKVLVVQLEAIIGDIDKNIQKVKSLLEETKYSNIDLIVLPELWTVGWNCEYFHSYSEELSTSKTYNFLKEIAIKYHSNVIGGSSVLKKHNEKDRNTCLIFDRNGKLVDVYDKFHLFSHRGQSEGSYLEEGETPVITKLDIGKVGISICYDIRFPEQFRLYAFNGVDFMVNMSAWPSSVIEEYVVLARARAIENQCYFICSCLTGKINEKYDFTGNSMVIDYRGNIVEKLAQEEKVLYAELNIDEMNDYNIQMPILKDTKKCYQIKQLETK